MCSFQSLRPSICNAQFFKCIVVLSFLCQDLWRYFQFELTASSFIFFSTECLFFFPLCKWSRTLCYCPSMSSFPFVSWWGWALKHNVQKVKVTVVLRKWAFVFWNVHLWYYQTIIIVNLTIKYMLCSLHFSSMNRYMYQIVVIQIYWQNTIFLYSFIWNCRTSCMLSAWMFGF